jgi:hypothetical protein
LSHFPSKLRFDFWSPVISEPSQKYKSSTTGSYFPRFEIWIWNSWENPIASLLKNLKMDYGKMLNLIQFSTMTLNRNLTISAFAKFKDFRGTRANYKMQKIINFSRSFLIIVCNPPTLELVWVLKMMEWRKLLTVGIAQVFLILTKTVTNVSSRKCFN